MLIGAGLLGLLIPAGCKYYPAPGRVTVKVCEYAVGLRVRRESNYKRNATMLNDSPERQLLVKHLGGNKYRYASKVHVQGLNLDKSPPAIERAYYFFDCVVEGSGEEYRYKVVSLDLTPTSLESVWP